MGETVEQVEARLRSERAERLAEVEARRQERREAASVEARRRREAQLRREAAILYAAAHEPDRRILGRCWLCGSTDIPDGLVRFQLPPPLSRVDGSMCGSCRRADGWAETTVHRLWAERPELCEGWGWRPYPSKAIAAVRTQDTWGHRAFDNPRVGMVDDDDLLWTVPVDWHRYTFAWHLLEWRRAHSGDDKAKKEPQPKSPFSWLR